MPHCIASTLVFSLAIMLHVEGAVRKTNQVTTNAILGSVTLNGGASIFSGSGNIFSSNVYNGSNMVFNGTGDVILNGNSDLIHGSGVADVRDVACAQWSSLFLSGSINASLVKGDDYSVQVKADDNLMDAVEFEVERDTLFIYNNPHMSFAPKVPIKVIIRIPSHVEHILKKVNVESSSKLDIPEKFKLNGNLELQIAGSGRFSGSIEGNDWSIKAALNGSAKFDISGSCNEFSCEANGSANLSAKGLVCESVFLCTSGSVSAFVHATKKLDVLAGGNSSVYYSGNPAGMCKIKCIGGKVSAMQS